MTSKRREVAFDNVIVDRSAWDKLLAVAAKLEHAYVKVGILASRGGNQKHPDGDMTLIDIAATHEFGSSDGRIPERAPIRKTFLVKKTDELAQKTAELAKAVITRGLDPMRALAMLGMWGASAVKNTITEEDLPPPNAPSTIAAKGSSKPLVDTGLMKNSMNYEVVEG